ncbi:MAG TPA: DUF6448 family protein [candidate division Zixibacteria bacterium]|nr:DUF6448 family protein [candidate division Zixibacteria bacterium]
MALLISVAAAALLWDPGFSSFVPLVLAHCDTLDGPVVQDARKALEAGNVDRALIWVRKPDEAEIREAFNKTLAVRRLGAEARELADRYFFETLVRVHRSGEGEPYTGLKPAGSPVDPGIEAADRAVETGSVDALADRLGREVAETIRSRFSSVMAKKRHKDESVAAGRDYVEAYVAFIHQVEKLHALLAGAHAPDHGSEMMGHRRDPGH